MAALTTGLQKFLRLGSWFSGTGMSWLWPTLPELLLLVPPDSLKLLAYFAKCLQGIFSWVISCDRKVNNILFLTLSRLEIFKSPLFLLLPETLISPSCAPQIQLHVLGYTTWLPN